MRNLKKLGLALIAAVQLGGCSTPADVATSSAAIDGVGTCQELFVREAACTNFIPMLVDLRIKHDLPAGIAERAREPDGRAELIAMARDEWKIDSAEPARGQTCEKLAAALPAETVAAMQACLQRASCHELVACVAPLHEQLLR